MPDDEHELKYVLWRLRVNEDQASNFGSVPRCLSMFATVFCLPEQFQYKFRKISLLFQSWYS